MTSVSSFSSASSDVSRRRRVQFRLSDIQVHELPASSVEDLEASWLSSKEKKVIQKTNNQMIRVLREMSTDGLLLSSCQNNALFCVRGLEHYVFDKATCNWMHNKQESLTVVLNEQYHLYYNQSMSAAQKAEALARVYHKCASPAKQQARRRGLSDQQQATAIYRRWNRTMAETSTSLRSSSSSSVSSSSSSYSSHRQQIRGRVQNGSLTLRGSNHEKQILETTQSPPPAIRRKMAMVVSPNSEPDRHRKRDSRFTARAA